MIGIERKSILGVSVDMIDMNLAIAQINNLIKNNDKGNYIFAINAEKIIALQKDSFLKEMSEKATLLIPDGMGAVLAIRILYGIKVQRVPGVDLMHNICKEASKKGYKIFIYGAKEEVNREVVEKLYSIYPGINIVGRCNGYLSEEKMGDLVKKINESQADILFIALGSPKQEKWIQKYLPELTSVKICQGIGGTLDTIVGHVKRAPELLQKSALEWLYRLIKEPKRIRRQIIIPIFVLKILRAKIRA